MAELKICEKQPVRAFLFLLLGLLIIANTQAQVGKPLENLEFAQKEALEKLKKEIQSFHLLLDEKKKTPVKNNDALRKRFCDALEKAREKLKTIDNTLKTYDIQGQTGQALPMSWKTFEQNMFSQIASFQDYMQELQKIYIESIENKGKDQGRFRPVIPGKETTRTNLAHRSRRKKTDKRLAIPSSSEKGQGAKVSYHYTTELPKNPDDEPFLK